MIIQLAFALVLCLAQSGPDPTCPPTAEAVPQPDGALPCPDGYVRDPDCVAICTQTYNDAVMNDMNTMCLRFIEIEAEYDARVAECIAQYTGHTPELEQCLRSAARWRRSWRAAERGQYWAAVQVRENAWRDCAEDCDCVEPPTGVQMPFVGVGYRMRVRA